MATSKERMKTPPIVSQQEWQAAHQQMLVKEKAFTRSRDALAAERRRMPWTAVAQSTGSTLPELRAPIAVRRIQSLTLKGKRIT